MVADTLGNYIKAIYKESFAELMAQVGVAELTTDTVREWVFTLEDGHVTINDESRRVCLLNENGRLYSLKRITVKGQAVIEVSEIPLKHGQLRDLNVQYSYGEGEVLGRKLLVVASATEGNEKGKLTFRFRTEEA
jgi:hypothetical protein